MGRVKWVRDGGRVHCHVSDRTGGVIMRYGSRRGLRMGKRIVTVLRRRWGCIVVVVGVIWIVECRCLG